jgi:hypothetical protein
MEGLGGVVFASVEAAIHEILETALEGSKRAAITKVDATAAWPSTPLWLPQLTGSSAGTLDDDFTPLAHDNVLCTKQRAPLAIIGIT